MNQRRMGAILALLITALVLLLPAAGCRGSRAEALGAPDLAPIAAKPLATRPPDQSERPAAVGTLGQRLAQWPDWRLPAPLPRARQRDLAWPDWFVGDWRVSSTVLPDGRIAAGETQPGELIWSVRFRADGRGGAVADRAFNARSVGKALLGDELLMVQDDPANPDRQLSRLSGDRLLESTVLARGSEQPVAAPSLPAIFLSDELSLQVLHRPGQEPRVSQVETLGRWQRCTDGGIEGEQWQASYPSPAVGLAALAVATDHLRLRLDPLPPQSDPAS